MSGQDARGSAGRGSSAWLRDVMFGARLALTGGREGWIRTSLTVVGVGLGVAMLLAASALPNVLAARHERVNARDDMLVGAQDLPRTAHSVLDMEATTTFRGDSIRGRLMLAEGDSPVLPPGVSRMPAPGEMVVSPALKDLLESSGGALLRPRLPYKITGTIGDAGLDGPRELAYYAASDSLVEGDGVVRIDHFGAGGTSDGLDPVLMLLMVIILVVLLLPIGVFVAAAIRFGGERRDRRLAALRLVGSDGGMTRRIAAGEAVLGAIGGLLAGGLFFLAGRTLAPRFRIQGISMFPGDLRPSLPLAVLIALAVPVAAVGVTLISLRRVVIEPLGVVRRAGGRRRRLWWRLVLPIGGLAMLVPLFGSVGADGSNINGYLVAGGTVLLLVGITAVLPWLVEAVVRRLGGAGAVPWQLAVRRLQLDAGISTRMINGIAVAAAGGIALQMLFGAIDQNYLEVTGQDPSRARAVASVPDVPGGKTERIASGFTSVPGVRGARALASVTGTEVGPGGKLPRQEDRRGHQVYIADCPTLRELADLDRCADGDTFISEDPTDADEDYLAKPGVRLVLGDEEDPAAGTPRWTLPAKTRKVKSRENPMGWYQSGILATPGAIASNQLPLARVTVYLQTVDNDPDVYERLRNAAAGMSVRADLQLLASTLEKPRFASIRRGLFIGVVATLLLIGASLLVGVLEQLRERRKLLAVLVAFGTRRSTLIWSVLWQTALPVFLGLSLALVGGAGLGAVLLKMVSVKIRFDWVSMAQITGAGAGVVFLVTLLSLPALWRMMRPDGLRTE